MGNPFERFGVSDSELARAIRESAETDAAVNEFMANQIIPYGKSISPVESGAYAASWKIMQKARGGKGVCGPTDWKSHLIEDGTGGDTPTPEHGTVARTVAHFGGTMERGVEMSGEGE